MKTETLTIEVRPETAERYRNASEQDRLKMELLIEMHLQDYFEHPRSLTEIMDELSKQAEENGLTEEKLKEILNE